MFTKTEAKQLQTNKSERHKVTRHDGVLCHALFLLPAIHDVHVLFLFKSFKCENRT